MGMSERQREIMEVLKCRKQETIKNLAFKFGVSERTIRRDIDILSVTEPIYTRVGRCGGICFAGNLYSNQRYMSEEEAKVLYKISEILKNQQQGILTAEELRILDAILKNYTRPIK